MRAAYGSAPCPTTESSISPTLAGCVILGGIGVCAVAVGLYVRAVFGFERALDKMLASSLAITAGRNNA